MKTILIIPRIKIDNANAFSSPYTAGFPAISAFGGFADKMMRDIHKAGLTGLEFGGLGIVSHKFNLRAYRENRFVDASIIATSNPLTKDGERPSFVPEIKCNLEVSIICEIINCTLNDRDKLPDLVKDVMANGIRVAGGNILGYGECKLIDITENPKNTMQQLIKILMPGYAIIERRDMIIKEMEHGSDALNALLDGVAVNAKVEEDEAGRLKLLRSRMHQGWIVPVSVGYAAIGPLGHAIGQRNPDEPHRFVESIVTLGEFVMLHRIDNINKTLDEEKEPSWKRFEQAIKTVIDYYLNLKEGSKKEQSEVINTYITVIVAYCD